MFTGLVRGIGRVREITGTDQAKRLVIDPGPLGATAAGDSGVSTPRRAGDSVAIDGCCLTLATEPGPDAWAFDVIAQTLSLTTLGDLMVRDPVNLEPSLRGGDELGGHMVQGHIEGVGDVTHVQQGEDWRVTIRVPETLMPMMVPKGSVSIAGVSLTLAGVDPEQNTVTVALIPTTLRETTMGDYEPGTRCNIETDMLARTVINYMDHYAALMPARG